MEFHILCEPKDISRYVFVPGDHDRAKKIADHFENARPISDSRGYRVFTGSVDGIPMTVCSTGMGGPQVAIAIEELGHMGADTFIRVGSCGTLQDDFGVGDVMIASGVVRSGGTANGYLPLAFPAVANFEVLAALVSSAKNLGISAQVGLDWSSDTFYSESDPGFLAKVKQSGVKSVEMEADTLFIVSTCRGWRAGALFACDGTTKEVKPQWGKTAYRQGEENAIRIAIQAMKEIALADAK